MLRCFEAQTYSNRELVVVHEGLEPPARKLLEASCGARLVEISADPKRTLGELRNLAVAAATGDYVCCWDDDDWHSPRRLELQLQALTSSRADACVLSRWLILDESNGRAYASGYRRWEGSLLCQRELGALEDGYPALSRGEDRELMRRLERRHEVCDFDRPELCVYTFHGENTWDSTHFQGIFASAFELAPEDGQRLLRTLAVGARQPATARKSSGVRTS
jgi:glycosyltransferase involved in cell wall biosynthesis